MRVISLLLAIAAAPGPAFSAQAQETLPGIYFSHGDWELACDNTGTCRAAGYQAGQNAPAASVLLTRTAGPGAVVSGQLLIGEPAAGLSTVRRLTLRIDGRSAGTVSAGRKSVQLAPGVVDALLRALPPYTSAARCGSSGAACAFGTAGIAWTSGQHSWPLSSQGAAAVLLKMDEFQGRVGTRGALVRPGTASEALVPPATSVPVVTAARWAPTLPADASLGAQQAAPLRAALRATLGGRAPTTRATATG